MILRFIVGDQDSTLKANRRYHEFLNKLEIAHTFHVLANVKHNSTKIYDEFGEKNWQFYRNVFGDHSGAAG